MATRKWLTVRVEDGNVRAAACASEPVREALLVHNVVGTVEVELPPKIAAALVAALASADESLAAELRQCQVTHLSRLASAPGQRRVQFQGDVAADGNVNA